MWELIEIVGVIWVKGTEETGVGLFGVKPTKCSDECLEIP